MERSLQETYAPTATCFGCGRANPKGLRIRSFPEGDGLVAEWRSSPEYEAWPGMLSGGAIGTLLDCHCNWTAAWTLMRRDGLDHPPSCVTAEYTIKLLRPTPTDGPIRLAAHPVEVKGSRVVVEGTLTAGGEVCATCRGVFVAVKPEHPAYGRW